MDTEAEIDRLYGTPLDAFVQERNELAKRLTKEGDREAAARVKGLRKPTVGAWALNQAVRRRRTETEQLLQTGEQLRAAHEQLLSGGDAGELRDAMKEERRLTSAIADCAEAIASESGKSGPALRERVRSSLHAASVDEQAREELQTGRFVREREAVGLGTVGTSEGGAAPPAKARSGRRGGAAAAERSRAKGKRAGVKSARPRGEDAAEGKAREAAERNAHEAAERERREAEAARRREEALAEAERVLAGARSELEDAETAHAEALAALEEARDTLRAAEDEERDARRAMRERSREVAKHERALARLRPRA
jgi:hypothetical protein